MLTNAADLGNATAMFYQEALVPIAVVVPVAMLLAYMPRRLAFKLHGAMALSTIIAAIPVAAVFNATGGLPSFPSPYALTSNLVVLALTRPYYGPRQTPQYAGPINPRVRRIVYVVDESVRGDFLGINNPSEITTPFLSTNNSTLINFGIAASITNCSIDTRLALRAGLRRDQIPDYDYASLKQTSMWQFAKRAGFKTVYLDAFRASGGQHSYMNRHETAAIDKRVHFADRAGPDVDMEMGRVIRGLLEQEEQVFIYADKGGVHFPYFARYPDTAQVMPVDRRQAYEAGNRPSLIND
jgi:lipid A ethanolaminephosphotransferase